MFSARIKKNIVFSFILLILLYVFMHIAQEVIVEKEGGFDRSVEKYIAAHRTASLTAFFSFITYIGSSYFLLPAYLIALVIQFTKNKQRALFIALIGIISSLSLFLAKEFFKRIRPDYHIAQQAGGYSFPSGHTMSTLVFFGLMIFLVFASKRLPATFKIIIIIALVAICLLVGISRMYLGVHYASDVIAGYCLGSFFVFIAYKLFSKHAPAIKKQDGAIDQTGNVIA
jgi:undecaprenyl-diphosphatase